MCVWAGCHRHWFRCGLLRAIGCRCVWHSARCVQKVETADCATLTLTSSSRLTVGIWSGCKASGSPRSRCPEICVEKGLNIPLTRPAPNRCCDPAEQATRRGSIPSEAPHISSRLASRTRRQFRLADFGAHSERPLGCSPFDGRDHLRFQGLFTRPGGQHQQGSCSIGRELTILAPSTVSKSTCGFSSSGRHNKPDHDDVGRME